MSSQQQITNHGAKKKKVCLEKRKVSVIELVGGMVRDQREIGDIGGKKWTLAKAWNIQKNIQRNMGILKEAQPLTIV